MTQHSSGEVTDTERADHVEHLNPADVEPVTGARLAVEQPDPDAAAQIRHLEDLLHASEARYHAFVTAAAAQITWTTPPSGLVDDIPLWRAYTGQTPEEVRGSGWVEALHPDDREHTARAWEEACATGSLYETEYRLRRVDGVYRSFLVRAVPVLEPGDGIREWVGCCTDITERKQLEQRTQEALHAMLEMALTLVQGPESTALAPGPSPSELGARASTIARRLAELTMRVLGCRRVAINAVEPETEVKRAVAVVGLPAEQERAWWARWQAPSQLTETLGAERVARLRAGEVLHVDLSQPPFSALAYGTEMAVLVPVRVGEHLIGLLSLDYGAGRHEETADELALMGAVAQLVGLVIEWDRLLREREEARASVLALERANRRMDEFLGIASHELRTPLTAIKANLQVAQRRAQRLADGARRAGDPLGEQLATFPPILARTLAAAEWQERLVNDLLDVSRIQEGNLQLRPAPFDLAALIRECVEEQRHSHPARRITFATAEPSMPVVADVDRIRQVVTQYIANALKYSRQGTPVAVRLGREGGAVRVSVRDEGPGLPAAEHTRAWDRFYSVAGIRHRSGSSIGLGLGLYISKSIVERHGGEVGLESAPGEGSTFWFTLPCEVTAPVFRGGSA